MCGADREAGEIGYCGMGALPLVAKSGLHFYEEPPISGENGSGTMFFCGCNLKCVFCQNKAISRNEAVGDVMDSRALANLMLDIQDMGAHNINLVTATHFADTVAEALRAVKDKLSIPVIYNTSGYERVETLKNLDGLIDIYMPDLKYCSSELSEKYSYASDYFAVASEALREMYRQVGHIEYGEDGMLKKGVLVRHLVLPGARKDSMEVIGAICRILPKDDILVSIMRQYTPEFARDCGYKELKRRLTTFEYESIADMAIKLGIKGFFQGAGSADTKFTPDF
jgi:putative pyruvate formate lyase activating enzyme